MSRPIRSASGSRSTMPSSACITWASMPYRSASRAPSASAHGACTCAPNGEWMTTRQSPSSSRNRSTRIVRSSGTWPQASRCSDRYARTLSAAQASRPAAISRSRASSAPRAPSSLRNAPTARPSSSGRPSWSPFQNGSRPGTPGAGVTSTRSRVMSTIRQDVVPSVKTSPTRDSYTISSSSSPTRPPPFFGSAPARNTPNRPRSGIVPPEVTASRCAPGRPVTVPATRSQTTRGRSSANASDG